MAAVTSEGAPGAHHQLAERLRAAVLGPRGGGTTRRRASDAFRLGLAVVVVAVSIPVMKANSAVELSIVHAVHPPPAAISWLVTTAFWVGSAGVSVLLVIVGLLVPRLTAVRWTAVAAVLTWGVCILLGAVLGPAIQAESQHRGHAIVEQVFADVTDGPLAHMPSGSFAANAAWTACAAIAHNLLRAAGSLASLAYAKARGATLRRDLIDVAARAARHGHGHLTLHLPEGWHREHQWMTLFQAACGPPAPAA